MNTAYTKIAITLHWLVALLIFSAFPLGLYMSDLKFSPLKLQLYSYHKWIGVTIFLLFIARLLWRITNKPPELPESIVAWQRRAAHAVHHLLYTLLFLIPVTGWLMSSAKGVPVMYLGLVQLPDLLGKDKALGNLLETTHSVLNYLLLALVIMHIAAALKHHLIEKDETLTRMMPWLKKKTL